MQYIKFPLYPGDQNYEILTSVPVIMIVFANAVLMPATSLSLSELESPNFLQNHWN
jgi:hypothetical protein